MTAARQTVRGSRAGGPKDVRQAIVTSGRGPIRWRWVWARAQITGVAVSTLVWLMVFVEEPVTVAVSLVAGVALVAGWTTRLALWLRFGARRAAAVETEVVLRALVLAPSFRGRGQPSVLATMRRHVAVVAPTANTLIVGREVMSRLHDGRLDEVEFCNLALGARAEAPVHRSRVVAAVTMCELPWLVVVKLAGGAARVGRRLPLLVLAWRFRWVVLGTAFVQAFQASQWITMAGVIAITIASITTPRWRRAWLRCLTCLRESAVDGGCGSRNTAAGRLRSG